MQAHIKPVDFLGSALNDLRDFPPLCAIKAIGAGVQEIRLQYHAGAFRVIYIAKLKDAIYVLHCFQKKSQRTAAHDIALASKRYNELMRGAK